uniref:Peptidase M24 domain-containing protein n=2 Tax=Corethron hystrix TaxID=216773 RepID=A0A7S1G319_9STRA|mmetsp:Transcript_9699/g.21580  ORF Transcript_9699/g.21580 Transcript_9699/m.21580 type:complete len:400 (+) Transcript_9699:267-1466(+)|eukprot:CAMPEP_0113307934 /NCGR_PEP_ID=MMETSP0010_2-20120614/6579_1 /TAXON_ID=216773 ORGANISM="Corethron hystrix, Strain 308" /NCGR_SAMPLE_ID=MMETSP0010_2 /ASSEMBLY_ACC=CAM_ASM_000155 /LENGTH=399 /DNA_ID=CAMNT_0000162885 /DNA_START=418 /DNA_END=1617 /DNA_ORIENTATION=+ /assembly_acc=CAM_ASM_000155
MSDDSSVESVASEEVEEEEEITDLSNSDVCTKYQEAARIANLALTGIVSQTKPGVTVLELCVFGEAVITSQVGKLYNKKVDGKLIEKGVAFPVSISVNDCVCNNSPLSSEEQPPLSAGDIIKVDLGCHIDGYISVAAHTIIVPSATDSPVEIPSSAENIGDVAVAAYNAMLVASACIKAGAKNTDVTTAVERVAASYGVNAIAHVRMHQMKRFVIDGVKEVALRTPAPEDEEEKLAECTFEANEVYAVDVAMSSGDGKVKESDMRTTIFKRNVESNYRLKMKASRYVLNEVNSKFPTLPFTLRMFDDERQAKMGITECVNHGLVIPYPSLNEKSGALVAHFKSTVLVLPSGPSRVTGLAIPDYFKTDKSPDDETAKILEEIRIKAEKKAAKKKKKKNKK